MRWLLGLWVAICLGGVATAQDESEQYQALTDALDEALQDSEMVGFTAILTDGQATVWQYSYGHMDAAQTRLVSSDSLFRAGSVTKTVTAMGIMRLVDEGRLSLSDPVRNYLPVEMFENAWEDTHPITIAHLLEHTTGWDDLHFDSYGNQPLDMTLEEGAMRFDSSRVSRWQPGMFTAYSNAGPTIAGLIIEAVTGQSYVTYITDEILVPLGMSERAGFNVPAQDISMSFEDLQTPYPHTHIWAAPAGGLAVSANDLAHLVRALMNDGGGVVSPERVAQMETPSTALAARLGLRVGDGMGLETRNRQGRLYHYHSGAIDGFLSEIGYLPGEDIGYVLLSNTVGGDGYDEAKWLILERLHEIVEAAEPLSVQAMPQLDGVEGYYQPATSRNDLFYFLDLLLGASKVRLEDDKLIIQSAIFGDEETLFHVGNTQFAPEDAAYASHALVTLEDRYLITTPNDVTLMQVSVLKALGPMALLIVTLVGAGVSVLVLLVGAIVRGFKRFSWLQGFGLWIWPALSGFSFAAFFLVLASALNTPLTLIGTLGQVGATSLTLFVLSLGLPGFAAAGLVNAVTYRDASRVTRILGGMMAFGQFMFAVMLFTVGWVGFTSWSHGVSTYPVSALAGL